MPKTFFIDTTLCTACKGCQVACKQWHDLPAEKTTNRGSCQNPEDLSFTTYKLVRMNEAALGGRLHWLFFPDQCRHCIDASCLETADNERAVYRDPVTGAILYTALTRELDADALMDSCPYNIPRKGPDGTLSKCDMCNERVHNGLAPACVANCPTGCMHFGDRAAMISIAAQRLEQVRKKYPEAMLLDPKAVNAVYLVAFDPFLYSDFPVAGLYKGRTGRLAALGKMTGEPREGA
jgi:formate dehydrogenase iron-sulfur subunit